MRRENREKIRPNRTQGPAQPPPEPTPSNPTPKPHGDAANGTTNVRWDLSRPSAGRSPPPHVPGQPDHQSTAFRTNSAPPSNPNPEPHGHAAIGTTNVRWDLSRPSAGRSPPPHVPGQPNNQSTAFRPDSTPHRSQATRTRSGTDGLKAILHSRTPAASFRAHRRGEPRPTPTRDRRPHSANSLRQPRTARPRRHRHDECKVGLVPPVRWTLPTTTRSRAARPPVNRGSHQPQPRTGPKPLGPAAGRTA